MWRRKKTVSVVFHKYEYNNSIKLFWLSTGTNTHYNSNTNHTVIKNDSTFSSIQKTRWWKRSQELRDTPIPNWYPSLSKNKKDHHHHHDYLFPSQVTCQIGIEECLQRLSMQISDQKYHKEDLMEQLQSCWNILPSSLLTGRMVQNYLHGLIHYKEEKEESIEVGEELKHWLTYMTNQYLQTKNESWRPTVEILSAVLHRLPTLSQAKQVLNYYLTLKIVEGRQDVATISSLGTPVCAPNVYCFVNVLTKYLHSNQQSKQPYQYDEKKRQSEYKEAWDLFFNTMQKEHGIVPTLQSWNVMLQITTKYTNATTAQEFLLQQIPQPDVYSYSIVLQAYSKEHRPYKAYQLLEHMINHPNNDNLHNLQPNTTCLNIVLSALATSSNQKNHTEIKTNAVEQAEALFHEMTHTYHQFDEQSLNIMLKLYINNNNPAKAQEILYSWSQENNDKYDNIVPDIVSYNTVIHGWALQGKSVEAQSLFDNMLAVIQPDLYTYNTLISAWVKSMVPPSNHEKENQKTQHTCNQRAFQHVNTLFQNMKEVHNIEPDTITLNTCIAAASKADDVKSAYDYLHQLEDDPILQPNIVTYSTILDAHTMPNSIHKSRQQSSLEKIVLPLIQRMEEHSVSPNVIFYNTILHILPVKHAHDFLMNYMIQKKNIFDGISYCTVLSAWSQEKRYTDKAYYSYELYKNMMNSLNESKKIGTKKQTNMKDKNLKQNKIPSKLITKALNFVLKSCAYTPKHASDQHRQSAQKVALDIFFSPKNVNTPYKDSTSFATMMILGTHFSMPNKVIKDVFNECIKLGYVNEIVLNRLAQYEQSMKSSNITTNTCQQLGVSKITMNNIPHEWKRNAVLYQNRN